MAEFNLIAWLLANPWRTVALALIAVVGFYHFVCVPGLERTIANKESTIVGLKVALKDLQGKVEEQNAAVDAWKKTADDAQHNQKKAMDEANKVVEQKRKIVLEIQNELSPPPEKECEATLELLRKYQ